MNSPVSVSPSKEMVQPEAKKYSSTSVLVGALGRVVQSQIKLTQG